MNTLVVLIVTILGTLKLVICANTKREVHRNSSGKWLDWWQSGVIYQIYPRSFQDSDGDGIGDINGIYERLDYIHDLGVCAIWFSPIFTSPMIDFGYDISNFREIDPVFGTMEDFEKLLKKAHSLDIKILLDLVPNHTSDQHRWFKKSVKGTVPYKDYYIWREGKYINGVRHPPTNWVSCFGKGMWTWNEDRQMYYLHQFAPEQPDLNYRNFFVYEEMINIIRFWLDKGVDGYRVDSMNHIYEDERFLDEPLADDYDKFLPDEYGYHNHTYTKNQDESFEVAKDWREVMDEYSEKYNSTKILVVEAYGDVPVITRFYGDKERKGVHFPFNFLLVFPINKASNATFIRDTIQSWYDYTPEGCWANWVLGNHDQRRVASRYSEYLVDGYNMLQMLLPGTAVVYYGDELGMQDTFIRWDQVIDPRGLYAGPDRYMFLTRDPVRSPMQWNNSDNCGFTTNFTTWLPVNPDYIDKNVVSQSKITYNRPTHLEIFKELVQLRKNIVFQKGDLHMYVLDDYVLAAVRSYPDHSTYIVVVNFGSDLVIVDLKTHRPSLPETLRVVLRSINANYFKEDELFTNSIKLRPHASLLLTTSGAEDYSDVLDYGRVHLK